MGQILSPARNHVSLEAVVVACFQVIVLAIDPKHAFLYSIERQRNRFEKLIFDNDLIENKS